MTRSRSECPPVTDPASLRAWRQAAGATQAEAAHALGIDLSSYARFERSTRRFPTLLPRACAASWRHLRRQVAYRLEHDPQNAEKRARRLHRDSERRRRARRRREQRLDNRRRITALAFALLGGCAVTPTELRKLRRLWPDLDQHVLARPRPTSPSPEERKRRMVEENRRLRQQPGFGREPHWSWN